MGEPSSSGLSKSGRVPCENKLDSLDQTPTTVKPPKAKKKNHEMKKFEDLRYDSYYWFRDRCAELKSYLYSENRYALSVMSDSKGLIRDLYTEMKRSLKKEDYGDEFKAVRRPNFYYHRWGLTGKNAAVYNIMAPSFDPLDITLEEPYYGVLEATAKDNEGDEIYDITIYNAHTRSSLETLEGVTSSFEWAGKALVYIAMDKITRRPYKAYLHNLRTKQASDKCLYHEKNDKFSLHVHASEDKKFLFVTSASKTTSFNFYLDVSKPEDGLIVVTRCEEGIDTSVSHRGNHFFILRRTDEFFNSEVVACPVACPLDKTAETIVLSHRESVKIQDIQLFEDHLIVHERVNGLPKVTIYGLPDVGEPVQSLQGGFTVPFDDDPTYSVEPLVSEFNSRLLQIRYSTLKTPPFVYEVDMKTGKVVSKESATVLRGFDASNYVIERKWANALDGTQIPISIVYHKDRVKLNGSAPLLLTGYGSYEACVDPSFESSWLCLLDRGFICAIAHIRGGGEMGRQWYENGKLLNKKNTFTDFIACAEYLIENKYCSKEKLSIIGASAGGLLICGVLNMRPDLFKAAVAQVPFVDVLTTMLDPTIPMTTLEWEGGEMGRQWYENGKLLNKKNTFTDFIACTEYLIENKYCSKEKLSIIGATAGGLLICGVLNMRPDLFKAAVAQVPFVDVLTTMLDPTIPMTTLEWEEWGDPQKKEFYHYMKSYSPVDNVEAQNYPNILVTTGFNDPRVMCSEPAKFVAKLRDRKTDDNLLLLACDFKAGYYPKSRDARLVENAFKYAFIMKSLKYDY